MFFTFRRLRDFLLLASGTLACGQKYGEDVKEQAAPRAKTLQIQTLEFARATRLLDATGPTLSASGGDGTYQAASFKSGSFRPSPYLVVPAGAAAFYQAKFAGAFEYKTFEFVSSGCNAAVAFGRYFSVIEALSGKPLPQTEKDQVQQTFATVFANIDEASGQQVSNCALLDLITCIADYSLANASNIQQQATSGANTGKGFEEAGKGIEDFATGALSCITEVLGASAAAQIGTSNDEDE